MNMDYEKIITKLPLPQQKIVQEIINLLEENETQTRGFAAAVGLSCKAGCGQCCEDPQVETTVTEMLPLAAHVWSKGQAGETLTAIEERKASGVCVFYQPDPHVPGNGRCRVYDYRPGICRLFGFSAKKDKQASKGLVTCKTIKKEFPKEYAHAELEINKGVDVPLIGVHTLRVYSIDPVYGKELVGINQAVKTAVERVGYFLDRGIKERA
jgi:uncharacterized protein